MRKQVLSYILILLLISGSTAINGCSKASQALSVTTVPVQNQAMEMDLDLSGVLLPAQTVDVSGKVSAQVLSLGFTIGSPVKQGDVLITLDSEAINGQLMSARATLENARAAAGTSENQAALAQLNLAAAQRSFDRTKALFESGAVPKIQYEEAEDKLKTAQTQYETASGPALQQAQANIDSAMASVKSYSIQLENTTIESPINGIIASQNIDVGEVLSTGTTVVSIVDTSSLKFKSSVSQENLALLRSGQELEITVDGYPDTRLKGIVSSIGPVAVSTGEVFPVEITVQNNNGLMAGMAAHASLRTSVQGIIVPSAAIVQISGQSFVYAIKDRVAYKRLVTTGLKSSQSIQILKGLDEGDSIAISNTAALVDQAPVQ